MTFANRVDAGRQLSRLVGHLRGQDVVVLGLPRGGVPVAFEVAQALQAPLDVIVVRKLGVPDRPSSAWVPSVKAACGSSTLMWFALPR